MCLRPDRTWWSGLFLLKQNDGQPERRDRSGPLSRADLGDAGSEDVSAGGLHAGADRLARVGSWRWDGAHDLYCSNELYRVFGFEPGEIEPTFDSFLAMVHQDDRSRVLEEMQAIRTRAGCFTVEYRIILSTGEERWVEARAEAIRGRDGTLTEVLGVTQDVTSRKQRETARRDEMHQDLARLKRETGEALSWLQSLQDTAPIGLGLIDRDFRYIRDRFTTATAAAPDRGTWSMRIQMPNGPAGTWTIEAVEESAEDGSDAFVTTRRVEVA